MRRLLLLLPVAKHLLRMLSWLECVTRVGEPEVIQIVHCSERESLHLINCIMGLPHLVDIVDQNNVDNMPSAADRSEEAVGEEELVLS